MSAKGVSARAYVAVALVVAAAAVPATAQTLDEAEELYAAGRTREAAEVFGAAGAALERDRPEAAAAGYNNACVLLVDLADYPASLAPCRAAARLRRRLGDEPRLARALNNLGRALQHLGRSAEAERSYREALAINRRRGDAAAEGVNLSNLGLLLTSTGRYAEAVAVYAEAVELAGAAAGEPWAAEQSLYARLNYGVVLEKLGAYRAALELYDEILAEGGALDPGLRATLEVGRGVMLRNLGDPRRAAIAFRTAIATFEALGDPAGESNAWLNLALAEHLNLERPRAAEAAYRRALELARASGDAGEEIQDLFYLGRLLLAEGRLDEAEALFARSLEAAEAAGSAEGRWSALDGLGRIAAARGRPREALDTLLRAVDLVEEVRSELRRDVERGGYFGDKRGVYAAAIAVLAELDRRRPDRGHAERAFDLAQRAKARELVEALGGEGRPAAPVDAEALRRRLGAGRLLELFVGEEELFAWSVASGGVRLHALGPTAPVLRQVEAVYAALAAGEAPPSAAVDGLSRTLLAPLGRIDAAAATTLWIAPDRELHSLPFELLETDGAPLVEACAVSYVPSASALAWLPRPSGAARWSVLGFGDPALPAPSAGLAGPAELLVARFGVGRLSAAGDELRRVAGHLGGRHRLRLGADATEAAFRQAAAQDSRAIHLATHSLVDGRSGRGTAVLLSPGGDDDGLLYPDEIARLEVRTRLAVLASCRSALESSEDGSALASLTGSFLVAGTPAVIAALWDVGDQASAVFMDQLYYQLGRSLPPAEALRRAKLRLRADPRWDHPALWSAYVLVGDAPAIVEAPWWRRAWVRWTLLALAVGLAGGWLAAQGRARDQAPVSPDSKPSAKSGVSGTKTISPASSASVSEAPPGSIR